MQWHGLSNLLDATNDCSMMIKYHAVKNIIRDVKSSNFKAVLAHLALSASLSFLLPSCGQ